MNSSTTDETTTGYTAFRGGNRVTQGALPDVIKAAKKAMSPEDRTLIFDDRTGAQIDIDLNGSLATILKYLPAEETSPAEPAATKRAGRPKLGVVPREVTLLPRHWEWLATQPGGASIALRKLVEEARRLDLAGGAQERRGREAAYRFMVAAAGDQKGFETASRALFAGDDQAFRAATGKWPADLVSYALNLWRREC